MAAHCEVCGKSPHTGYSVSHSHRRTKRRWLPNIQVVRVANGGSRTKVKACAACIKAGKVARA